MPHKWTSEEDVVLRREVLTQLEAQGEVKDWCCIANQLPGRTNRDCRKRWYNVVSGGLNKGHWTAEEDHLLINALITHGKIWTIVANEVSTRNADQCAKRWKQCLDPELDRSQWTEEENRRLLDAYERKGRYWKEIQVEYFPNRSRNAIKNQYTILNRRQRQVTEGGQVTRKRRTKESWKREKQPKPNPCNGRPLSVGEGDLIQADSGSSSSDEESCDEDIDVSEEPASSDPHRRSPETMILPQDSSIRSSVNSNWFSIPSPAEVIPDAPPLASLYEGITEEGLLDDIPELESYTWTPDGGHLDPGHNPLNMLHDISGQLDLSNADVHCDSGDMPLALDSHSDEQDILLQQYTCSLPKSALGEDMSKICYPDASLEPLLLESDSGSASQERITLTLNNPSSDTIASLIRVAVLSNSPFRFKRH